MCSYTAWDLGLLEEVEQGQLGYSVTAQEIWHVRVAGQLPIIIKGGPETLVIDLFHKQSVQFSSVTQLCLTLCDSMNCSMPGLHHQLPEFTLTHTNSHPSSPWCQPAISSSVIPYSSCPQSLPASVFFQWVNSSHEEAKVLDFQV